MASTQQQGSQQAPAREIDPAQLLEQILQQDRTERYRVVDAALQERISKVEALLPDGLKGQGPRLVKRAMLTFERVAALQQCTAKSFIQCVLDAAELGLSVDGRLGYAVPFNCKVKDKQGERWEMRAQFIPSYKGLVAVARRVGVLLDCYGDVICERDNFKARRTLQGDELDHERDMSRPRGGVCGAYAVFKTPDGSRRFELMDLEELNHVRSKSKSFTAKNPSGPWVTDPKEMYRKTVVRRGMKMYEEDAAIARALEMADRDEDIDEPIAEAPHSATPPLGHYSMRSNGPPAATMPLSEEETETAGEDGGEPGMAEDAGQGRAPTDDKDSPPAPGQATRLKEEEMCIADDIAEAKEAVKSAKSAADIKKAQDMVDKLKHGGHIKENDWRAASDILARKSAELPKTKTSRQRDMSWADQ